MTYTTHGHHIPFTFLDDKQPEKVSRCGGVRLCLTCTVEAMAYLPAFNPEKQPGARMDFLTQARTVVFDYVVDHLEKTDTHVAFGFEDVYVVWFSKTLQNWKALVSTSLPDGMYYEITHNGDKNETYLDAYKKFNNVTVSV